MVTERRENRAILIFDQNRRSRALMARVLMEDVGFQGEQVFAGSLSEFRGLLVERSDRPFDLVVSSLGRRNPRVIIEELLRIKSSDPIYQDVKMIVCTSHDIAGSEAQQLISAGVSIISKPDNGLSILAQEVRSYLRI